MQKKKRTNFGYYMTKQRDWGNGMGNMATARDRSCHFRRILNINSN